LKQLTGILLKLWECSGLFHELFKGFSNDSCSSFAFPVVL
jgi:hypothetical protein